MAPQAYDTVACTSSGTTVAGLLAARAADRPDGLAYRFLADGEGDEARLSYAEADGRARAVAAAVRGAGGGPGVTVLLVLPPGLDYVTALFGCLYAGALAVPVYPPDPTQLDRTLPRLRAVVRDAGPLIGLTTSPLLALLDWVTSQAPELGALRWLAVDDAPETTGDGQPADVAPGAPALLQYTSGSTAAPRGVLLSHANLLHNSGLIQRYFHATPDTRGLVWLPPYHDMGLIGGLLQPLYGGFPVTLMSPLHFLERPVRWLRAIDRLRITASGGPNFAYDLCARRFDPDEAGELDLSSWRVAFNGAEPVRPETLRRFAAAFAPYGFRADAFLPCYGLAEATLIVSAGRGPAPAVRVDRAALQRHRVAPPGDGPVTTLTACGPGADDQRIAIVDPATATVCEPDQVGEIWLSGPSVAAGYRGRSEETERVFRARLSDGQGPFLRTGDLGFLYHGQLVVTGRLKDLIIVRGRNHYPQDIELTAGGADPVLRPGGAAAFAAGDAGERLVVVHEVRRGAGPVDIPAVAASIRQAVAREHGLRVHTVALVRAGGLPKTSSGKVQRRLCRARFLSGELPEMGPADTSPRPAADTTTVDPHQLLKAAPARRPALLRDYLRCQVGALTGIPAGQLSADQPLLSAGLDSLGVAALQDRVTSDLAVAVPLAAVMAGASLSELAEHLAEELHEPTGAGDVAPAAPVPAAPDTVPLSWGERWMWFLQHMEPDSAAHSIAVALRALDPVDRPALARALDEVVARHCALRTTFPLRDGEPVRLVRPDGRAEYREHDARDLDRATLALYLARAARRPFDLESGPLLRLDLYRNAGGEVLLLSMHHIITDFWSMTILARELGICYTAFAEGREPALPAPRAAYADVLNWQRSRLAEPAQAARLAAYWQAEVAAVRPQPARPASGGAGPARGGSRRFALPPELAHRLHDCAAAQRVTLFVLLLAAFEAVLHRYMGHDDLTVGTNAAVRPRIEFADVVGCCTNPVMIRSEASPGEPFHALLSRTRDRVVATLQHQEFPMLLLATRERFGPMFDAMFSFNRSTTPGDDLAAMALVGPPGEPGRLGSLRVESFPLPVGAGALPIELVMAEVHGVPHGLLRYRGDVIDEASADRIVAEFVATLAGLVADAGTPLAQLGRLPYRDGASDSEA